MTYPLASDQYRHATTPVKLVLRAVGGLLEATTPEELAEQKAKLAETFTALGK
jgi:hypothetical protein